ncbi:hypothetical protein BDK51DRAFT_38743 [Blyttiomyces helicus]|uniref:Uncharacterized protein n=1 Tax=Blyttiomyces helicus TaxID=388810 RepID=A0A4P9W5S4_9FUNG|nr:hypothetical protein BDK51DRAFT_38743 [Blyttiomyces helicus]|eukprot:RKO87312.1 hypothetical protein BDK51DRAFT_38743 [Blyttiomyces helicus]
MPSSRPTPKRTASWPPSTTLPTRNSPTPSNSTFRPPPPRSSARGEAAPSLPEAVGSNYALFFYLPARISAERKSQRPRRNVRANDAAMAVRQTRFRGIVAPVARSRLWVLAVKAAAPESFSSHRILHAVGAISATAIDDHEPSGSKQFHPR